MDTKSNNKGNSQIRRSQIVRNTDKFDAGLKQAIRRFTDLLPEGGKLNTIRDNKIAGMYTVKALSYAHCRGVYYELFRSIKAICQDIIHLANLYCPKLPSAYLTNILQILSLEHPLRKFQEKEIPDFFEINGFFDEIRSLIDDIRKISEWHSKYSKVISSDSSYLQKVAPKKPETKRKRIHLKKLVDKIRNEKKCTVVRAIKIVAAEEGCSPSTVRMAYYYS